MLRCLFLVVVLIFIPTGCSAKGTPMQDAIIFRTKLMETGSCSFTAEITANYEDRQYGFTMACSYEAEQTVLEVLAPENIAGITAYVKENDTRLQFDGTELTFGAMANGNISPVSSPWLLTQCWVGEYIAFAAKEEETERITYLRGYDEEELTVDTWFSEGVPVYAEVSWDNYKYISIRILDFQV